MADQENYWTRFHNRRASRRGFLVGGGVLAAGSAAILAGCGDDDSAKTKTAAAGGTTAAASGTTPQASSATAATAGKVGGTFKSTKASRDTGLDPHITVTNALHPAKAYSHMLVYQASTNQFHLDMASKFEQATPTKMIFTLRDGLKFNPQAAGGRALTSADVKFSYTRFPDTLKNFGSEVNRLQWGWIDSIETPDDKTVVINLATPYASSVPSMGSSAFAVVAKELVEANAGTLKDVMNAGAGPYMMTKRDSSGTRYERNPNYYKHSPAAGPFVEAGPYIDAWEEAIVGDVATIEAKFLAGDSDFYNSGSIDKLKADELKSQKGVNIIKYPNIGNFGMNLDAAKWMPHPKLREALSLAIDRDQYIKTLLLGDGIYGSSVGPIFDSVLSQEEIKSLVKFDAAKAKALWAEGNGNTIFPNGLRTVSATFDPTSTTYVDFVKRQLEANLGIKVTVTPADLATYVALATAPAKDWEFFMASENSLSTIPDYNGLTFYTPTGYGAIFGNMRLDSPVPETAAFAKLQLENFTKQGQELDPAKRKAILQDIQRQYFKAFAGALPLPVAAYLYGATRDRVKNWPEKDAQFGNASLGAFRAHNLYLNS